MEREFRRFAGELRRLVVQLVRERRDPEEVGRALAEFFRRHRIDRTLAQALQEEALRMHEWLRAHTAELEEIRAAAEVLRWAGADVARAAGRIQDDLLRELTNALARDASRRELERIARRHLERILERGERYMFTVSNTALAGIDRIQFFADARAAGIRRFRYVGPPPIRKFCKEHYNQVYTWEEIQQLDNGQGLPVWIYGGGYNCRHRWVSVVEPEPESPRLFRLVASAGGRSETAGLTTGRGQELRELYSDKARVLAPPEVKPQQHELKLARILADRYRRDVVFIPPSGEERRADALVGDEYWEFKTITEEATNLYNAAYQHLRKAKKKASVDVIVLHLDREVSKEQLRVVIRGVRHAIRRDQQKRIKRVLVIDKEGNIVYEFERGPDG